MRIYLHLELKFSCFLLHHLICLVYFFFPNIARILLEQCLSGNEDPTSGHTAAGGIVNSNDTGLRHINVLVTSGSLIPSLVKCLLFRFDGLISYGNGE